MREEETRTYMSEPSVRVVVLVPQILVVADHCLAVLLIKDQRDDMRDLLLTPNTGILGLLLPYGLFEGRECSVRKERKGKELAYLLVVVDYHLVGEYLHRLEA
jgi:hypothetical protein